MNELKLPNAGSVPRGMDIDAIRTEISRLNIVSLANNTKWNELINCIRGSEFKPSYRSKWINGHISEWDVEWYYHLPFPFIGVYWLEISINDGNKIYNWIVDLVKKIGFEYDIVESDSIIRIWGYAPKSMQ